MAVDWANTARLFYELILDEVYQFLLPEGYQVKSVL